MVCGKVLLAELREDRKRVRCKGCNKNPVFPPSARKANRRAAADRIVQLDSPGQSCRLGRRPRLLRLRQSTRHEHYPSPRPR